MAERRQRAPRQQRQIFVVATEGEKSEAAYLALMRQLLPVSIRILPNTKGLPPRKVVQRLDSERNSRKVHKEDQYWIAIDVDNWSAADLRAALDSGYRVAISNPCFEVWLLAHYENPSVRSSCDQYRYALDHHVPRLSEHKNLKRFRPTLAQVEQAVKRMQVYNHAGDGSLPAPGCSTFGELVAELLRARA